MKILFINSLYSPHIGGGAEITLQSLVEGLKFRGHQVSVLSTGPNRGLIKDVVNGVSVYRAEVKNFYWNNTRESRSRWIRMGWHWRDRYNGQMRKYVKDVIERERPDLVCTHNLTNWSISVWDEITAAEIPIVQVLHDFYLKCVRSNQFARGQSCDGHCSECGCMRRRHAAATNAVRAVVGVSDFVLREFKKDGFFEEVPKYVIHNARRIANSRAERPLKEGGPVRFGYIGTLARQKGVEWLLEQFSILNGNASLTIAGSGKGDYADKLKNKVSDPRVRFVGYMDSATFFSEIDVCIVPSIWSEPLGMVAIEACAHGIPVIAASSGGLPEIIRDGENGLLCTSAIPDSLSMSMKTLCDDHALRVHLAKNARDSVSSMIDIDRMLDCYENLFQLDILKNSELGTISS
ncbi:glycosyltransferase family 4 protein [Paraburkholderia lacunae]|uniref:Glycosyl transferase family 1 n=1 Tax=Paraburkholderia lacunae TaxID=2211104 RepID=A0A370NB05_9BURK|nr:glycosyltransferase family 4 protein [Paraburkholderia lacunae]RDK02781.1 glycosyl transferase family 1 [Paraburkholderia lacunae]